MHNWVRQAAGERLPGLEFNLLCMVARVTDQPAEAAEEFAAGWREGGVEFTTEMVLASPHILLGSLDQICEKLERLREEYGISYNSVFESDMESFAPLVHKLAEK